MNREPAWVPEDMLHLLHDRQVELFGGSTGVRDPGSLSSALHRPRQHWEYGNVQDLADLAAIYLCAVAQQQGFVDGNKRTAGAVALTFLEMNGFTLEASESSFYWLAGAAAEDSLDIDEAAEWIRRRLRPIVPELEQPRRVRMPFFYFEGIIGRLKRWVAGRF